MIRLNLSAFSKISKIAYLAAFITFCMRAGHFMSLPFLAIYLSNDGLLSPGQIGLVLGISGFMVGSTGLINGMYVDRSSHKKVILVTLFLSGFCYFAFSVSIHNFFMLLFINAALGWLRSLTEISVITLSINHTKPENLSYAFNARFIGGNLGVVLGPLIGALMARQHSMLIFWIAGGINLALGAIMCLCKVNEHTRSPIKNDSLLMHFRSIIKEKLLIYLTLINFILWFVYSSLDTTLPQYLAETWKDPATVFSTLMITNAIICVLFQPIILRWAELTSLRIFGIIGCLMFSISFLMLSVCSNLILMIIAVIFMSFAELFTMPINALLMMRKAPKHLIGGYNGLFSFSLLGLSVGPFLGGYGLQYIGGPVTFFIAALVPFIAVFIYFRYIPK